MCYAHWQEPAEHVQKYLLLPQGQEVWPWLPSRLRPIFPSYIHLFSNQSLKCVGQLASRISNIKLCHIVISNHSIYRFIFSKKCKRYSNPTQFKFFFSSFNFPKEEFQEQDTLWSVAAIGGVREPDSPSVQSLSAQSHSCKDIQVWKILGTLSFGAQVNLKCPGRTSPPKAVCPKTQPLRDQEMPTFYVSSFCCPPESQWLMTLISCLKSLRNNFLFLSGSEHICPFKQ